MHHPPTPIIAAQMMEPNRMLDEFQLASVKPMENGFLLDMGRNYTGWFELTLPDDIPPGTQITMEFADKQLADGKYQTYGQRSEYVARGGGGERFRNRFNYAAFRYALVTGLPRAPKPDEVQGLAGHDQLRAGLNVLVRQPAAQSDPRHDVLDVQEPQPGRLHRGLSAPGAAGLRRRLRDIDGNGNAQFPHRVRSMPSGPPIGAMPRTTQGDVPYTAPYSQDAGGGPVWSGFCITMPWQIYLTYGDRRPLEVGMARDEEMAGVHRHENGRRAAATVTWGSAVPAHRSGTSWATGCRREENRARTASMIAPRSSSITATWCTACNWPARSAMSWAMTPRPTSTQPGQGTRGATPHAVS